MKRKEPSKPTATTTFANSEIQHIEQLLALMSEHNLEEFEYSQGDLRIRLKKPSAAPVIAAGGLCLRRKLSWRAGIMRRRQRLRAAAPAAAAAACGSRRRAPRRDLHLVKSPIVGTYYESPSPGSEPFVKVGGYIETGKTLCIVEAMKLMNEIESDISGEVLRIFVENGQPVEYGQPLFGIRPSRKK